MEEHGLFAGKVLWVDLTEGGVKEEPLNCDLAQKYIGGWGMNARLAYDLIPAGMDAYHPEMPLIFGAGLLSGTPSPGSPKGFLTTKDAASGTVYTAVAGLLFATALKWAGYDHMVIVQIFPGQFPGMSGIIRICYGRIIKGWIEEIRDQAFDTKAQPFFKHGIDDE